MASAFDPAALAYDENFTRSVIGQYQRGQVYRHLSRALEPDNITDVLEINCGTGEDASWLAAQQFKVTATDISENMIAEATKKNSAATFLKADINEISEVFNGRQFDLIFSNFGGLNCLSPEKLENFFKNIPGLLTESGKMILVIMPKNTLWERLYFLLKRDFKNMSRRKKGNALAYVDGEFVDTFYYNPSTVAKMAKHVFNVKQTKPIGFFVPPSYLEPQMTKRPKLAAMLDRLDHTFCWSILSKYADHYFIILEKQ